MSERTVDSADPIVTTAQGRILGRRTKLGLEFRGIPFAQPPRGPLRFAPPRRIRSFNGGDVLDARYFGDPAPQAPPVPPFDTLVDTRTGSESCLSLNVWTPDANPASRHPVMVWIHGGGYWDESGSDRPYWGHTFSRDGIVFVSINYRLGVLGFLHVAESFGLAEGSGNFGSLDQIAALEWVQENIAAFGGDSDNVTIFGESAGSWSVATLLASRRAAGLFKRAICQSGGGEHVLSPERAQVVTDRFLALSGISAGDVDSLRSADLRTLLAAQERLYEEGLSGGEASAPLLGDDAGLMLCLLPVTTGDVVGAPPRELVAKGAGRDVDLLLGTNTDESALWRLTPGFDLVAPAMLELSRHAISTKGLDAAIAERHYRDHFGEDDLIIAERMETDRMFRLPIVELAYAHALSNAASASGTGRTFLYEFLWSGTSLGACHMSEIPFVFDQLGTPMAALLAGPSPSPAVAALMHSCWMNFATNGDPDPDGRYGWERFDATEAGSFMIDELSKMEYHRDDVLLANWRRGSRSGQM